jgi:hypothetical protein
VRMVSIGKYIGWPGRARVPGPAFFQPSSISKAGVEINSVS